MGNAHVRVGETLESIIGFRLIYSCLQTGDKCGQSELCISPILSSKLFWPSGSYTITWSSCKLLQITCPSNISAVLTEECAQKIVDCGFE